MRTKQPLPKWSAPVCASVHESESPPCTQRSAAAPAVLVSEVQIRRPGRASIRSSRRPQAWCAARAPPPSQRPSRQPGCGPPRRGRRQRPRPEGAARPHSPAAQGLPRRRAGRRRPRGSPRLCGRPHFTSPGPGPWRTGWSVSGSRQPRTGAPPRLAESHLSASARPVTVLTRWLLGTQPSRPVCHPLAGDTPPIVIGLPPAHRNEHRCRSRSTTHAHHPDLHPSAGRLATDYRSSGVCGGLAGRRGPHS